MKSARQSRGKRTAEDNEMGSSDEEAELSSTGDEESEEDVLEPKVLPQRQTRGGRMNQVFFFQKVISSSYQQSSSFTICSH